MNNHLLLKQARNGIKRLINEDSEFIKIKRKPLTNDGFQGTVINPYGKESEKIIKCRISHEKKFTGKYAVSPPGFSTNLSRFILVDFETTIYENDSFKTDRIDKQYKIGIVDPLEEYGGIIGYQAPLTEAVDFG